MSRKDPFRTLDDPEPVQLTAASIADATAAGAIAADTIIGPQWFQVGGLRIPLHRPGRLRRLIVWLLLGWRWSE